MSKRTSALSCWTLLLVASGLAFVARQTSAVAPDLDGDGVADEFDDCSNTPTGTLVNSAGRPLGDLDGDCDADLMDFDLYSQSVTGPLPPLYVEICDDGVDNDNDGLDDCLDIDDCPMGTRCANTLHCSEFQTCGCPSGRGDCDGCSGNGCEALLNNNPVCSPPTFLGSISADIGASRLQAIGSGENWYRVRLLEDEPSGIVYLSATVRLVSAPNTDYDLYLRCATCGGGIVASSTNDETDDFLYPRWGDDFGSSNDDSLDIIIEVRFVHGACGDYTLTVTGHTDLGGFPDTCNP